MQNRSGMRILRQGLFTLIFSIALLISLIVVPFVQGASFAPFDLDGQVIFSVSDAPELTAEERAKQIHQRVQVAIDAPDKPLVEIERSKANPEIFINKRKILTIYPDDIVSKNTPIEQADIWSQQLNSAVQIARKERSKRYLLQSAIFSSVILALGALIHWVFGKFWLYPATWFIQQFGTNDVASEGEFSAGFSFFLKITLLLARIGIWVCVSLSIAGLFPLTRSVSAKISQGLLKGFTSPFLSLGLQEYSFLDIIFLIIMLMVLLLAINTLVNLLKGRLLPRVGIGRGAIEVITVITRYALITLGTIAILQIWGLNLSSLTIVGSALGVGIGFGLQGIAKNLISGLVLLFERSVQPGDFVQVDHYVGFVEKVSVRSITITTLDRISIIVPSSKILEDIVVNWSHDGLTCRLHVPIGVAYGSELKLVKALLLQAAQENEDILNTPPPKVVFTGFGDSSLDFEILIWVQRPNHQVFIKSDLLFRVDELFREHKIEIPFPQRDLHIRSEHLPFGK